MTKENTEKTHRCRQVRTGPKTNFSTMWSQTSNAIPSSLSHLLVPLYEFLITIFIVHFVDNSHNKSSLSLKYNIRGIRSASSKYDHYMILSDTAP